MHISKKIILFGLTIIMIVLFVMSIYLLYINFYIYENRKNIEKFDISLYPYVFGKTVKITTADTNKYLNLYGVFIYDNNGNLINVDTNEGSPSQSSNYTSGNYTSYATNALNYVSQNPNRKLSDTRTKLNLNTAWSSTTSQNCSNTADRSTVPGWWQYTFNNNVNISGIEIYGRSDCCAERISNALIQILDSQNNIVWSNNFRIITNIGTNYNNPNNPDDIWQVFNIIPSITTTMQSPTTTLQSPTTTLQSPTTTLQSPTTTLQSPTTTLQSPTTTLQSPTNTQPSMTTMQSPTTTQSPTNTQPSMTTTLQSPTTTLQSPTTTQSPTNTQPSMTTMQSPTNTQPSMTTMQSPTTTQSPTNTQPSMTTTQQSPMTTTQPSMTMQTAPLECYKIGMQLNLDKNIIKNQCNATENCYYANNSCYDKKQITPLPANGALLNKFSCNIGETPLKDGYLLQCPNSDSSNYLFTTISGMKDCLQSDSTCNLVNMTNANAGNKDMLVQYINGSMPQPLFISKDSAQELTNNFDKTTGKLYFSDIYNNTNVEVPFNLVPSINDVANIAKNNLLSPDYGLLSNIQNLNANIQQNMTLLTK